MDDLLLYTVLWEISIHLIFMGQGYPQKYFNMNIYHQFATNTASSKLQAMVTIYYAVTHLHVR